MKVGNKIFVFDSNTFLAFIFEDVCEKSQNCLNNEKIILSWNSVSISLRFLIRGTGHEDECSGV